MVSCEIGFTVASRKMFVVFATFGMPLAATKLSSEPKVTDEVSKTNAERAPQKPPRRQHVVPQFYLARWADDREQVLMTDKTDGRRVRTSLSAAAVIKDFYTVETTDGKSYAVEAMPALYRRWALCLPRK